MQLIRDYQIDTVLDIGANVEQYTRLVRKYGFMGRIISFEPLSEAHVKLVKNSRKDHKWTVAPRMALGSKDGKNRINISANCSSSSILDMLDAHADGAPESVYVNSEEVRIAKLDTIKGDYVGKENNIFLKIDVIGI